MILLLWTFTPNKSKTFFYKWDFQAMKNFEHNTGKKKYDKNWLSRAPNCSSF